MRPQSAVDPGMWGVVGAFKLADLTGRQHSLRLVLGWNCLLEVATYLKTARWGLPSFETALAAG